MTLIMVWVIYWGIACGMNGKQGFWTSLAWPLSVGELLADEIKRRGL